MFKNSFLSPPLAIMGIYILLSFVLSNKSKERISKLQSCSSSEQFVSVSICQKTVSQQDEKAIYQAFLQLLNDKGYDATTVQDIIDLADVETFYFHCRTKVRNSF